MVRMQGQLRALSSRETQEAELGFPKQNLVAHVVNLRGSGIPEEDPSGRIRVQVF